eukprot:SAG11_NODE_7644_length_1116_cov_1.172075_2_plen_143_part_00
MYIKLPTSTQYDINVTARHIGYALVDEPPDVALDTPSPVLLVGDPSHVGQQWQTIKGVIKTYLGPARGDLEPCFLALSICVSDVRATPAAYMVSKVPCIIILSCTSPYLLRPENRARGVRDLILIWPGLVRRKNFYEPIELL